MYAHCSYVWLPMSSTIVPDFVLGLCSRLDSTDYFHVIVPSAHPTRRYRGNCSHISHRSNASLHDVLHPQHPKSISRGHISTLCMSLLFAGLGCSLFESRKLFFLPAFPRRKHLPDLFFTYFDKFLFPFPGGC